MCWFSCNHLLVSIERALGWVVQCKSLFRSALIRGISSWNLLDSLLKYVHSSYCWWIYPSLEWLYLANWDTFWRLVFHSTLGGGAALSLITESMILLIQVGKYEPPCSFSFYIKQWLVPFWGSPAFLESNDSYRTISQTKMQVTPIFSYQGFHFPTEAHLWISGYESLL